MTLYLLNLADLASTLYALQHGGVELNPLMKNPAVMVAWKVVGVGVLCGVLEYCSPPQSASLTAPPSRGSQVARRGLNLCTAVYAAVCVYHLFFIGGAF